jgi:N-acetylmuramic acid 6-phosphate (MurNAc-6-P) etherase
LQTGLGHLLTAVSSHNSYGQPQDVSKVVQGGGGTVTYVELNIDLSSDVGNAEVVQGGLNKDNIAIQINAQGTTYLNIDGGIYGN